MPASLLLHTAPIHPLASCFASPPLPSPTLPLPPRAQKSKKLPPTWKYESATASTLVA